MKRRLLVLAAVLLAAPASAQTDVGENAHAGLYWAVAAPQGAGWTLECRFSPVTMQLSRYDRQHWANQIRREGQGPQAGRLPGQDGRCTLTKTGGAGGVGLSLVKNGQATTAGTADPAVPAQVTVF